MNIEIHEMLTVEPHQHGMRLDQLLSEILPDFSRSQISRWIKEKQVLLNENEAKPKDKVKTADKIALHIEQETLSDNPVDWPAEDIPLNIIYEDESLLVLNKPAGLVVHPGAGNPDHTLVNALLFHQPSLRTLPRAGIVHRLDKDTTGLMVVAKTSKAYQHLVHHLQERDVSRKYKALVQGELYYEDSIETCFGRHHRNRLKMAVCQQGKEAITHYEPIEVYDNLTLVRLKLETGRTHQIRVHMAHIHHPIIGDQLYGAPLSKTHLYSPELLDLLRNFKRQALHAYSLSFQHPESKKTLTFTAPIPDDFQQILDELREDEEFF